MEYVNRKKMEAIRDSVRYMNGSEVSYDAITEALNAKIEEYGIPARVVSATLGGGGLFAKEETCIALVNPEHLYDYYKFCIYKKDVGKTCIVDIYSFGTSKNMKNESLASKKIFDGSGAIGTAAGILHGGAAGVGFAIGSAAVGIGKAGIKAISKGIGKLFQDENSMELENEWYRAIAAIFDEVIY